VSDDLDVGRRVRREVLGDEFVDRSDATTNDFTKPLQDLAAVSAWAGVWTRPGLDRRTRSLITLAMLTALGRQHEVRIHVAAAVRNGCTEQEIQEVLLHSAVYCGMPAAVDSFRVADEVLTQLRAEG
jgi:4-carboxymuconolactone decarboxylase